MAKKEVRIGKNSLKTSIFIYGLLAWPLIHFLVFWVYIHIDTIVLSFQTYSFNQEKYVFVGFKNYVDLVKWVFLQNPSNLMDVAIKNSLSIVLFQYFILIPIPLIFGFIMFKKVPLGGAFKVIFFLPNIISDVVMVVVFKLMFDPYYGPIQQVLNVFGVYAPKQGWFGSVDTAWNMVLVECLWAGIGYNMILFLSAYNRIPTELFESATLDGAGPFREFITIALPLISPTISTMIILSSGSALTFFMNALMLTDGGPDGASSTIMLLLLNTVKYTFELYVENGNLYYVNGDVEFATENITICDGTLRHFAIVLSETDAKIYVDGVEKGIFNISSPLSSITDLYIGREINLSNAYNASEYTNGFNGCIADLRLWTVSRTAEEIINNKDIELTGNEANLVGYWKLDKQEYLNSLTNGYVAGTTNGNTYANAEEYYQKCMGYKDYSSNAKHGVFYSDGWYNLENITTDYTIIQISDTQSYMFGHPEYFDDMYSWMAESKEDLNIVMVQHLGDVCQDSTAMQWKFTFDAFNDYLKEAGIPFTIALGNHDYFSPYTGIGSEFRDKEYFVEQFPIEVMSAQYDNIGWARYGGSYYNYNADNTYIFIEAGGIKYMVITLEYGPRQEVINWAEELVNKYSDYKVILLTHCYYDMYGTRSTFNTRRTTAFSDAYEGTDIWNKFIDKYENIVMVNCGHSQNNYVQAYVNTTSKGTEVVQILSDPSAMVTGFPSDEGIIELMCFTDDGFMHTYYYSPVTKMFRETQFECTFDMADALDIA